MVAFIAAPSSYRIIFEIDDRANNPPVIILALFLHNPTQLSDMLVLSHSFQP